MTKLKFYEKGKLFCTDVKRHETVPERKNLIYLKK